MNSHNLYRIAVVVFAAFVTSNINSQPIVSDNYTVTGSGTGFALNAGVNSGINPPTTRLTGSAAGSLRYICTFLSKDSSAYSINNNKLRVTSSTGTGRFCLSADGVNSFNYAPALGTGSATPSQPVTYDLKVTIVNNSAGLQRCSFALGTVEGDATTWDFGAQLYRNAPTDNYYTIGKRIDVGSSGLASDVNSFITNTAADTHGNQVAFLIRVTDAGAQTTAYNSRVRVSLDGGFSWIYDTATDPDLPNGWRLDGAGRHIMWDVASDAGTVTFDTFSVAIVPPVAAQLVSPQPGATDLSASALLKTTVSNPQPGDMSVTFYGRETPSPYPGPDFCIAVLPDTQNYAREESGYGQATKEMWIAQTEWILTNRVQHNIVYVAGLGDIVQNGDIDNGAPNRTEWRNATNAMYRLEDPDRALLRHGVPYGLCVGNHDQEPIDDPDGTTDLYNEYFGISHFTSKPYYGGHWSSNNDNHYALFSVGGLDFIVLYFENERYGSTIMNWANTVLDAHPGRRCIAVMHSAGSDTTPSNLSAQGQAVFDGLKDYPGLFMMLGGHVFANGGEGSRANTYQGRTIRTFISDYQNRMNGGNGWMRLMYFSPSNNTYTIKTYSPWLNQWETDADSQMTFTYNMDLPSGPGSPGTAYAALGTVSGVESGETASFAWTGLSANKTYDWYVQATDALGGTVKSDIWTFSTRNNTAPSFSATPPGMNIAEGTPIAVTNAATDATPPANGLAYSLLNPPSGASINSAGVITWTPTEAQGPGSYVITTKVSDDGAPPLSTTNSFSVTVAEVNAEPAFASNPSSEIIAEFSTIVVTNAASDADVPANALTYQLLNPPSGASISAAGVITWTPTEAQGPGSYVITTKVSDDGVPALSATNSFTITVDEWNSTPAFVSTPPAATVPELSSYAVTNAATDADAPANALTYQLLNPPSGASISAAGVITWTPTEAQGPGNYVITTKVSDDGVPVLSATNSFSITVTEVGQLIISDTYNVAGSGTGFALNTGVNSGINPPTTRLTGAQAPNQRYLLTFTGKATSAYSITGNRLVVGAAANSGRFTFSANGTTPFNFAQALGADVATPANPAVYDIGIKMDNDSPGTTRFSFALSTQEADANAWDFAVQLYRASSGNNYYTIQKRVDRGSYNGTTTVDATGDINAVLATMGANTFGTEVSFLIRVTDAGAETTAYNSRVQVSLNGGSTWIYDTSADAALSNRWRLDGSARYLVWDVAGSTVAAYNDLYVTNWTSTGQSPSPPSQLPTLDITRVGQDVRITWPAGPLPWPLKSANDPLKGGWETWKQSPAMIDGINTVIITNPSDTRFFRLGD